MGQPVLLSKPRPDRQYLRRHRSSRHGLDATTTTITISCSALWGQQSEWDGRCGLNFECHDDLYSVRYHVFVLRAFAILSQFWLSILSLSVKYIQRRRYRQARRDSRHHRFDSVLLYRHHHSEVSDRTNNRVPAFVQPHPL